MGRKAGSLLWNRMRVGPVPIASLVGPGTLDVSTSIVQPNQSFADYSPNEPTLGSAGAVAPSPGDGLASRVQVIPQAPTSAWAEITHSEPYVSTVDGTVHVTFFNASADTPATINVLFWDPHALIGPGAAMTYNPLPPSNVQ